MIITGKYPNLRLRRNRKSEWIRRLVQETNLTVNDLILPIFLTEGINKKIPIKSMPGIYRYSINKLLGILDRAIRRKIPMVALFPYTNPNIKDVLGSEALKEIILSWQEKSILLTSKRDQIRNEKIGRASCRERV